MAGIPKRSKTDLSVFLPTNVILNMLFEKCTTPVSAMAISIGKNMAKTGVKMVPSPNPEKNVKMAVKNAAKQMIIISIYFFLYTYNKLSIIFKYQLNVILYS